MAASATGPSRPAFYARISLDRSGQSVGVDHQIAEGLRHLALWSWPEPDIYEDNDISAHSGKFRPGFERLLADIEAGVVDGLAARHLDRLLRRVTDLERLLNAIGNRPFEVRLIEGAKFDLSTMDGRMLARILASVASGESELKGERVRAARRREAHAGKAHGLLGYGYDDNQQVVDEEAAIIREVADRILAGDSLRSIASELNERSVPTPGAGRWDARRVARVVTRGERIEVIEVVELASAAVPVDLEQFAASLRAAGASTEWTSGRIAEERWSADLAASDHGLSYSTIAKVFGDAAIPADVTLWRAANVRAMIRRGALCGWREFSPGKRGGSGELIAPGSWPPILDKATTEKLRQLTDRPGVRGRTPKHLLAGILRCRTCGSPMGGGPDGRGGTRYSCSKQPGLPRRCGGMTVAGAPVDAMISRTVIDELAEAKVHSRAVRTSSAPPEVLAAEKQRDELKARRSAMSAAYAEGSLDLDDWIPASQRVDELIKEANRVIGSWAPSTSVVVSDVPASRDDIQRWWDVQTVARRREVISMLIVAVPVKPAKGSRRFDPSRIDPPIWRR